MVQQQTATRMLKLREVLGRRARGVTSHYKDIQHGLFTKPVKTSVKSSAWPESEVEVLVRARIAGKTDDEIRLLVEKLQADRAKA
jgi:prophage regulatory protein